MTSQNGLGVGQYPFYALPLVRSQTINPITRTTRSTPVQTPALKISPITSQPGRATAERSKSTKRYEECFIGILRCGWYAHLYILASDACRAIGFQTIVSVSFLRARYKFLSGRGGDSARSWMPRLTSPTWFNSQSLRSAKNLVCSNFLPIEATTRC
jgi:hypothetical protein